MTIVSAFHAKSTALEVVRDIHLKGRNALVTGGASGLGLETSRALVAAGASVTLAVRNLDQGQQAATQFRAESPGADVSVAQLDLSDLASVRRCAADWIATGQPLDILINNAAIMACPLTRNTRGWEAQFTTNHLGHFVLTTALLPALRTAAARHGDARVVALSSSGHKMASKSATPAFEPCRSICDADCRHRTQHLRHSIDRLPRLFGIPPYSTWPSVRRYSSRRTMLRWRPSGMKR